MNKIKRALISVSDKTGIVEFAKALSHMNIEIISTGGTQALLKTNGIRSRSISEITGFPEMLDGRVKTLHPRIYGGLLFLRSHAKHRRTVKEHGILPIDLVVVNLYPFQQVVSKSKVRLEEAIENIDIGGPSMLRAAAKNHESVTVICDPSDYARVLAGMKKSGRIVSESLRRELALKVYRHTAHYDLAIAHFLDKKFSKSKDLPQYLDVVYERSMNLRYGENPHQRAALYRRSGGRPKFDFEQLQGKELSFNNIMDFESAVSVIREFKEPTACVVKHNNPCGIASDRNLSAAIFSAVDSDPLSSFGGIVGLNRPMNEEAADALLKKLGFFEVLVAPSFSKKALQLFSKRKNLRVIQIPQFKHTGPYDMKFVKSGVLLQDRDVPIDDRMHQLRKNLRVVTRAKPSKADLEELLFAFRCVKLVWSNAIVLVQGKKTVGIGCGQPSRVDSVRIACMKAGKRSGGSVLASDAFFPMPDNIEIAARHGIRAIIQPGGSIKDKEIIHACDQAGIAMVLTGERHFRH